MAVTKAQGRAWAAAVAVSLAAASAGPASAGQAAAATAGWSDTETAAAKSQCEVLLSGLGVDFTYLPPLKNGLCGTAQPIELRGLGGKTAVQVEPAAIINCPMAAALAKWFAGSVQPLAATWLKSPIVSIHNAAAYDCRNRYGDPKQKLSEHAKANALDILSFTTAKGKEVSVFDTWGPTLRALLQAPLLPAPTTTSAVPASSAPAAALPPPGPSAADLAAKAHLGSAAIRQAQVEEAARRGIAVPRPSSAEGKFVHAVHDSACQIFGTVLGPEANDAHKDHLHLDLAVRSGSSYCE